VVAVCWWWVIFFGGLIFFGVGLDNELSIRRTETSLVSRRIELFEERYPGTGKDQLEYSASLADPSQSSKTRPIRLRRLRPPLGYVTGPEKSTSNLRRSDGRFVYRNELVFL